MLLIRIRGSPESVVSMLKKMNEDADCTVYIKVQSQEELFKIVSLSIESGVAVEILPSTENPVSNPHLGGVESKPTPKSSEHQNDVTKSTEMSLLSKYKRRNEQQAVVGNQREIREKQQEQVKQSEKSEGGEGGTQQKPQEGRNEKVKEGVGGKVSVVKINPSVTQQERTTSDSEDVVAAVTGVESEQKEEIPFEEFVRMKEEAFSRKIVE